MAIASLVLSLVPLVAVGSILAIIFGYTSRRQIARSGGTQQGSGMAMAGIIIGWIGVVGYGVIIAALLVAAAHTHTPSSSGAPAANSSTGPSGNGGSSKMYTIIGTLEVDYPSATTINAPGNTCSVPPAWGNEASGDQVLVTNGSGNTLATGSLLFGTVVDASSTDPNGPGCEFKFLVSQVPDSPFYKIVIDGHGSSQYSESQLQRAGWQVHLSLIP